MNSNVASATGAGNASAKDSIPATPNLEVGGENQRLLKDTGESIEESRASFKAQRDAVDGIVDPHSRSLRLTDLGMSRMQVFGKAGLVGVLNMAVDAFAEAVKLVPPNDPNRAGALSNLGNSLLVRFTKTCSLDDLNVAINAIQEAVNAVSTENPTEKAMYLYALGNTLESRFHAQKSNSWALNDLNAAVESYEEAISIVPANDSNRVVYLINLGNSLRTRFDWTRSTNDWTAAVDQYDEALKSISSNTSLRASCLSYLNLAIRSRLEKAINGTEMEWDATITAVEQWISRDNLYRPPFLKTLGQLLLERFRSTNSMTSLNAAVKTFREADMLTPEDHIDKMVSVSDLGGSLEYQFGITGSIDDLNAAIEAHKKAVRLAPDSHPSKAASLNNLGSSLWLRAKTTGSIDDLNTAIVHLVTAVDKTVRDDMRRAFRLNNLAGALLERFSQTSSVDDLNAAVIAWQQAVELIPEDNQERPGMLSSLANGLQGQYDWYGSMDYLKLSIKANKEALSITPENSPDRGGHLNNLGLALYRQAGVTRSIEHANDSIHAIEEAIKFSPKDHYERPSYLSNLCVALNLRFAITGSVDDLSNAIEVQEEAVQLLPKNHPERASLWFNLGDALQKRFESIKSTEDRNSAIIAYENAVESPLSPPRSRINASRKAVDLLVPQEIARASKLLSTAVNLLATTSPRTGQRGDKQIMLSKFNALASDAAALSIRAHEGVVSSLQVSEALRLLELGRGVIAGAYFDTRSDITELRNMHPELANKFESLRSELDRLTSQSSSPQPQKAWGSQVTRRFDASKDFDSTVNLIRRQDRFQRFLFGPSPSDLKNLASLRTIVYLNVSRFGADAFLITSNDFQHLPLTKLFYADLERNTKNLLEMLGHHSVVTARRDNVSMKKILEWLWDVAIEPILELLGYTNAVEEGSIWPRVVWVPVGQLSLFPLHAAGYDDGKRTAIDRVISTYTPTLRALSHAKIQLGARSSKTRQNVLLASMPTTPNKSPLPFAAQEIGIIDAILPPSTPKESLQHPTKAEVLQKLAMCSVGHFACHGEVHSNPSKSQLLFSDWEKNALSVADVASVELPNAQLAVLSACHAANMRNLELLDEAIHIAGACQLAGFPTVIGTLWQVQDHYSPMISETLYQTMLREDGTLDIQKAAEGLHFAVRKVREDSREGKIKDGRRSDDPMAWAPYIHVGI
jgi:CHAT domain-containing protein/tetratricopeptide (TPR) repeat protein